VPGALICARSSVTVSWHATPNECDWIAMAGRVRGSAQEGRGQMVNPPERVLTPKRRRRLDPEDRQREIVDGAVAFFAEVGFDGLTEMRFISTSSNRARVRDFTETSMTSRR
jgi:hypothetical protein